MNFFKRNKPKSDSDIKIVSAPATTHAHPFSCINRYSPLSYAEFDLYKSLREAVPLIDAAIDKTVRLMGRFYVETEDINAQQALDNFMETVPTGGGNRGIYHYITTFLNEMLTYGQSVGEIVLSPKSNDISALYIADFKDIEIRLDNNPLNPVVYIKGSNPKPAPCQELLMPILLNPQPGTSKGTSILKGLPFVSSILIKIFNSIGNNWERVGNVRYAVTYKPDTGTASVTAQQAQQIADEWSKAMKSTEVCDFVSVGDVNIKVIGADNQILDCDVPVKHLLEQIVAKLSLPPFVLGLSWSSTERMSTQQADILTSELEYYRSLLTPVIRKIACTYLRLNGYSDKVKVKWSNINLQDELDISQARLRNAQALEIEQRVKREYKTEVEYEEGSGY